MAAREKEIQQHTFLWEGTDRRGARHTGETVGPSLALVKADLRRQGIMPVKVRKNPEHYLAVIGFKN